MNFSFLFDTLNLGWSTVKIIYKGYNFQINFLSLKILYVLANSKDPDEMWHFIWVFTVCQRTPLGSPTSPIYKGPGHVAQSVTCLATDASLTTDPGVASSIPARSHTFVEIDHEILSTDILLPSAESFKKGCCQLQAKVCARSTG